MCTLCRLVVFTSVHRPGRPLSLVVCSLPVLLPDSTCSAAVPLCAARCSLCCAVRESPIPVFLCPALLSPCLRRSRGWGRRGGCHRMRTQESRRRRTRRRTAANRVCSGRRCTVAVGREQSRIRKTASSHGARRLTESSSEASSVSTARAHSTHRICTVREQPD